MMLVSIGFRQTNVVWLAFAAGVYLLRRPPLAVTIPLLLRDATPSRTQRTYRALVVQAPVLTREGRNGTAGLGMVEEVSRTVSVATRHAPKLVHEVWPFAVPMALFAAFVVWNDGIVLGPSGFSRQSLAFMAGCRHPTDFSSQTRVRYCRRPQRTRDGGPHPAALVLCRGCCRLHHAGLAFARHAPRRAPRPAPLRGHVRHRRHLPHAAAVTAKLTRLFFFHAHFAGQPPRRAGRGRCPCCDRCERASVHVRCSAAHSAPVLSSSPGP